ncbi:hypothetical protein HD554DRAFT_1599688 [Boletus coccyginus]|nr:hypothetical protein HD554DRAFT_1599688 [Boletus coccyginus]
MSAYGALSRSARASPLRLPTTAWLHPRDPQTTITLFHFDSSAIGDALSPSLFNHLHAVFADEVDKGLTYPQEDVRDPDLFRAYFFAADVVIAIMGLGPQEAYSGLSALGSEQDDDVPREVEVDLERARAGRSWDECVVGFYYVKPNYPGRSSHICNAGFLVPPSHRAGGYGRVLARSYLYYAPRLGYEVSVFNLVYVNNVASVKLWERLGFVKAGLIPRAGRLRRTDGPGEEYVDAWVFHKRFDEDERGHVSDA